MKRTGIGRHNIEYYDSIDEMPIERYQKFNKYLLVDSGIGSDLRDFDTHIEKVLRFLSVKDTESVQTELENMRQCVYMVQQGLSPKYIAFSCLVARLDGKEVKCTDDDIKAVYDALKDVRKSDIDTAMENAKKKVDSELSAFFPSLFESAKEKEYYDILKKLTEARLRRIQGETVDVESVETKLMTITKPRSFTGAKSVELAYEKEYERLCLIISSELHANAKAMTVKEYYMAYEILKERNDEQQKLNKNGR